MQDKIICYILMHDDAGLEKLSGCDDSTEFRKWLWEEVGNYQGEDEMDWLKNAAGKYMAL